MSLIAINVSTLTILQKLARGQDIKTKSTNNPDVPGNATVLAAFSALQSQYEAAEAAVEANRGLGVRLTTERDAIGEQWLGALTALAAFTESATGGDAVKMQSAGFDVRAPRTPPQPVGQIKDVRVTFTGEPGKSEVRWKRDANADAYRVQCCHDPITEAGWMDMGTVTRAKFVGNGAIPGKLCWYRAAAVNALGQGPWSEPALRPVM